MSLTDVRTALGKGDFYPIAGKYCLKDDSWCLTLDDKGKATSVGSGKPMLSPDDPQSVTLHAGRTRVVTIGGRCRRTSASSSWGRIATIAAAARKDSNPAMGRARRIARPKSTSRWTPSMCQPASAATNWRDWPARATSCRRVRPCQPDSFKPFLKMEGYHMNVVPPP